MQKAALIVAYLILYRLSCHHILQVAMAIVYLCMRWSMVHVCLLRTPKWCGDLCGLNGAAIATNNPLCLIRLHVVSTQETTTRMKCHTSPFITQKPYRCRQV